MIEALFPGFPKIGRFCFGRSVGGAVLPQDARGPGLHPQQKEDLQAGLCLCWLSSEGQREPRQAGYEEARPGKRKGRGGKRAGSRTGGHAGECK